VRSKLVPAGSLIQCRVSEKISSELTDIGDPIVLQRESLELALWLDKSWDLCCDICHAGYPHYGM
jgi:hypothetical protein